MTSLGEVPREQKMLKGHLLRVIYRKVAEDAQGTPTHSHTSPSILVHEDKRETTSSVQPELCPECRIGFFVY